MFDLACFNIYQIYAIEPNFNRNNLTRWINKGYLLRLRRGLFTFPEYKAKPQYVYYFANRIYSPSYVSLHSALSFYGMIPEAVVQITSVTSLKTAYYKNDFGEYSYKSLKKELMFGYELKSVSDTCSMQFAMPEKALLDLLYLYPFYNSESEFENLRLDEAYLHDDLKKDLIMEYSSKFESKVLDKRIKLLFKVYDL
jgi:predicted transcriptional regulator of viral defense system